MKRKIKVGSLRLKTWFYFLMFSVIVLILTWVSQVFLLEASYLEHKKLEFKHIGSQLALKSGGDVFALNEYITDTAVASNINIFIIDQDRKVVLPFEVAGHSKNMLGAERFDALTTKLNSQGYALYRQTISGASYLIYGSSINFGGEKAYAYISAPLEPVSQAANLLKYQLFYITIVVILLSFILAFIFSADLSKPVLQMSRSARRLAKRDFKVNFEGSPYQEINELAQALNYAKTELMQAEETQRSLIANVSHDLKTPLTMIKAYAEMIRDISGDDKVKRERCTDIIISETDRLTILVDDILKISRAGASLEGMTKTRENLSELVRSIADKFRVAHSFSGYDIQSDITDQLFCVMGKESITQALYNLVANAVNYTGDDKKVSISLRRFGDLARFEVKDTGAGIPKEQQEHIWNKYHRAIETHKRPVSGSGLGLSIVKSILTAHTFNFGVISSSDGSCFYVDFPLCEDNS